MYRVIVNTMGPVQVFEFRIKNPEPNLDEHTLLRFDDVDGVIHCFETTNIIRVAFYPIKDVNANQI